MISGHAYNRTGKRRETPLVTLAGRREVILGILIVLIAVVMPFLNQYFLSYSNLGVLLLGSTHYAFMAIGICLLLVMGEIDLSIGSNMAMAGIIVSPGMKNWGLGVPASIALALLTTILIGMVNGLLVVNIGINFLISTLATAGIVRGLVVVLAEGGVAFLPQGFNVLGQTKILGLQSPVWVMFAAVLIVGVLNAARFGSASSTTGTGSDMIVISAIVLGGCSLSGGLGEHVRRLHGVIFITLLSNVLVMLNVSTYWHQPVNGVVPIGALSFDILMNRWKQGQERRQVLTS